MTGPNSPELASVDDLSGKEVFVRKSSSFWTHLEHLNERFAKEQKPPVTLKAAPEDLQDDDLLEMVHAGLVGIVVVDRYQARLWATVFKKIKPHEDVVVNEGGNIAWMIRKNSPKLKAEIAGFAKEYGQKSGFGNALVKKYTGSPRIVKPATSAGEIKKYHATVEFFRKYGAQYDMDYLLMIAQGYQESLLDQNAHSQVGAVGVMQLMPATGKQMKTGDISKVEPNIHAGVKYISLMRNEYFGNEPMDARNKMLFSFAAYNAGPQRVQKLRKEAEQARARSERLVQQRRDHRRETDRGGDGDLRGQYLQVLRGLHADRGTACRARASTKRTVAACAPAIEIVGGLLNRTSTDGAPLSCSPLIGREPAYASAPSP